MRSTCICGMGDSLITFSLIISSTSSSSSRFRFSSAVSTGAATGTGTGTGSGRGSGSGPGSASTRVGLAPLSSAVFSTSGSFFTSGGCFLSSTLGDSLGLTLTASTLHSQDGLCTQSRLLSSPQLSSRLSWLFFLPSLPL